MCVRTVFFPTIRDHAFALHESEFISVAKMNGIFWNKSEKKRSEWKACVIELLVTEGILFMPFMLIGNNSFSPFIKRHRYDEFFITVAWALAFYQQMERPF